MNILETDRLVVREFEESDAPFIVDILNQPSFIRYIADRGVRTDEEAREYIRSKFQTVYDSDSYGIFLVALKDVGTPIGMAGFVNRGSLPCPDIGFAFLPQFEGRGYAYESAAALLQYARTALGFANIAAITTVDNDRSGRLLERLGFHYNGLIELPDDDEPRKYYELI